MKFFRWFHSPAVVRSYGDNSCTVNLLWLVFKDGMNNNNECMLISELFSCVYKDISDKPTYDMVQNGFVFNYSMEIGITLNLFAFILISSI